MAYKQGEWGGNPQTSGNAGDKWGETWAQPKYSGVEVSGSRYGMDPADTKVNRIGKKRMDNLGEYTQDRVNNRSEIQVERKLRKAKRAEDRIVARQGSKATRAQLRDIGKGDTKRASERATNKAARATNKAARLARREARKANRLARREERKQQRLTRQ